ncbi:MAG: BamA/TamA family outer membrane protein, partial [Bacteroidetes bacterium]|nr:BamA/TamA family outer membrane protein [Bacteroidota bacterium]
LKQVSVLFSEVRSIQYKLLDNGYYYAKFDMPIVLKDTTQNKDSIIITFHTGKRQKIDAIDYIDSTKGQKLVLNGMKNKQLDIEIGDWYSISKVNKSNNNLLSLGTFDIVSIDTSSLFRKQTDSTLSLLVFTQYRKQQEWGVGLYLNRTAIDNFTNFGGELSYSHKNIGGIAQNFNIFGRLEFSDISRGLKELQTQLGVSLAQPLFFTIDKARFGFAGQLIYSYSKIFSELQLSTISLPIKFPVKFPEFTFIQFGTFDFLTERQVPMNFDEAYQKELDKADSVSEKEKIKSSFKIYEALNKYRHATGMFVPSAFIFGVSLIGDKRNDIFNPSSGYYFNFSLDLTIPKLWFIPELGIAQFYRAQTSYYLFTRLSPTTVFAFKVRGGLTIWGNQIDTYVPVERQFFAGGANSVRGWSSRRLRYPMPKESEFPKNTLDFFQDFVGSGVILEGSIEFRFRFPRPANFDALMSEIISNIVLTSFVDWGNTFHWYSNYNYEYNWYDYFTKLAVAGGIGLGYLLPVGPIRMDLALPIYDPSVERDNTIFTRENVMKDLKFHIGLGYSF